MWALLEGTLRRDLAHNPGKGGALTSCDMSCGKYYFCRVPIHNSMSIPSMARLSMILTVAQMLGTPSKHAHDSSVDTGLSR